MVDVDGLFHPTLSGLALPRNLSRPPGNCHPERSEGPAAYPGKTEIARSADAHW